MMKKLFLWCGALCIAGTAQAKITLPPLFSDGMVLQQRVLAPVWGTTDRPGAKITLKPSWEKKTYTVTADASGGWRAALATPAAGGPYTLRIGDGEELTLSDVLVGEVWLASGQSNMQMCVGGQYGEAIDGAMQDIAAPAEAGLRMFTADRLVSEELKTQVGGRWESASPATIPGFSATAFYFARLLHRMLGVPVGILQVSYGGSRIEAWMSPESLEPWRGDARVRDRSLHYNAMLNPCVGYGIRGCIWYQGESNIEAPELYRALFPAMVRDWRGRWGMGEFPFYFAQIAPFDYNNGNPDGPRNSAPLRAVQADCAAAIPNAGMVALTDLGDRRTIHPRQKRPVGERFAYLALARTYGLQGFEPAGPVCSGMKADGKGALVLTFEGTGGGLTTCGRSLTGFEVAGADGAFCPAQARAWGNTVTVSCPGVPQPVAVRYAFRDYDEATLFNSFGLPLATFVRHL